MNIKYDKDCATIIPPHRIDIKNAERFNSFLLSAYNQKYNTILVDFSHVTSLDSSGFGKLLLINKKLQERDGELKIINVNSPIVRNMFKAIRLHRVIHIEGMTSAPS